MAGKSCYGVEDGGKIPKYMQWLCDRIGIGMQALKANIAPGGANVVESTREANDDFRKSGRYRYFSGRY